MRRYERALTEQDTDMDNFYSIIDRSRTLLDSNDWWTLHKDEMKAFEGNPESKQEEAGVTSEA